ncbi:hypothetical protein [Hymenobacter jejuensis]|uniref:Uncharacterized protein n=1 Tax=Hymenobacter jejuensis TaxID=2502781 RepID=A0A5B8A1Y8_9BACT|nr:hypothetical protein [Hymenobacter jejuensis]QDA61157.1 hypothetical protein FHG12_14060 [Hymenobacter jejuensis]
MSNFLSLSHRPATLAGRQRYGMISRFPQANSMDEAIYIQAMKNWILLSWVVILFVAQACHTEADIYSPSNTFYQQQEDSVLVALFNQTIQTDVLWRFRRPPLPVGLSHDSVSQAYAASLHKPITLDIIEEFGFPLRLGVLCFDCPDEEQKRNARKEAFKIMQEHHLDSAFFPLLMQMWDKKDSLNTVRKGPCKAMQYYAKRPIRLVPLPLLDSKGKYDFIRFSRVGFNKFFDKGVFQMTYSDLGGGRVSLYCVEKRHHKWTITARQSVDNWYY